jgi:hypothetical protein
MCIKPWVPTPARLIPTHDPATVAGDLVNAVGEGVTNAAALIGAPPPLSIPAAPPAVTHDDLETSQPTVRRELAATRDQITETIGAVKSVIGNGRTIVRSASGDNGSNLATTTGPARKTPVRDAVTKASSDIKKVVTKVSDHLKKALSGGNDDDNNNGEGGEGGAQ